MSRRKERIVVEICPELNELIKFRGVKIYKKMRQMLESLPMPSRQELFNRMYLQAYELEWHLRQNMNSNKTLSLCCKVMDIVSCLSNYGNLHNWFAPSSETAPLYKARTTEKAMIGDKIVEIIVSTSSQSSE